MKTTRPKTTRPKTTATANKWKKDYTSATGSKNAPCGFHSWTFIKRHQKGKNIP